MQLNKQNEMNDPDSVGHYLMIHPNTLKRDTGNSTEARVKRNISQQA